MMLTAAMAACSQRVTPEEEYADQPRERPLLPAGEAPVMPAPGGATPMMPGGRPAAGGAAASGPGVDVTIELARGGAPPASGAILFVFVRPEGVTSGPPLAVRRVERPDFPMSFEIGPADAMMPGTVFPDRVQVQARLDQDGVVTTTAPGDWSARSDPVAPGGEATLVLSPSDGT